jgi:hypothetical protein
MRGPGIIVSVFICATRDLSFTLHLAPLVY